MRRTRSSASASPCPASPWPSEYLHVTANPPTNIVHFTGFNSSIISNLRGGIPRPMGNFPERLSPAMLVGVMLVGRLGV